MRVSLFAKLSASHVGLALLSTLTLGTVAFGVTRVFLGRLQRQHLQEVARYSSETLGNTLDHLKAQLAQVAAGEPVLRYFEKYQDQMLIQYFSRFGSDFPRLSLVSPGGQEVLRLVGGVPQEVLRDLSDTVLWDQALKQPNTTVVLMPQDGTAGEVDLIHLAHCRKNFFDEIEAVVVAAVPVTVLAERIAQIPCGQTGFCLLLDPRGRVLAAPSAALCGTEVGLLQEDLRVPPRAVLWGRPVELAMDVDSRYPWLSLATLPADEYWAPMRSLNRVMSVATLSILLLALVIGRTFASHLSRPIRELSEAASSWAQGCFDVQVRTQHRDELGDLCRHFNRMVSDLRQNTTSIAALHREIAERRAAQAVQAHLVEKLEASNRELQDFAHIVSHDLKAPLRGIKTLAGWLVSDFGEALGPEGQQQLALLERRVDRMKDLIDGILKYSRAGRAEYTVEPVDLSVLVGEIVESLNVPEHIIVHVPEGLPTVPYDRVCLTQVIQNLLSNAIKYMDKPAGRVDLQVHETPEHWTVQVSDNGPGIDREYHEKIFGIFQTLQSRDSYESTGVGLALVKKIVERLGGRVWVTSQAGQGSTFSFTIPRTAAPSPMTPAEPAATTV